MLLLALAALAAPLLALWNVAPLPHPAAVARARREAARASLGMMLYHAVLLLGSAACAAWLRRHLMVWKVFAPWFMAAVLELLAVDVGVLLGIGIGLERITWRVRTMFGARASTTAQTPQ